jgi:general secretion pathway protein D
MSPESIGGGNSGRGGSASGGSAFGSGAGRDGIGGGGGGGGGLGGGGAASLAPTAVTMGGGNGDGTLDEVRVVADEENNALMIYANGKQYDIIKDALKQLDVVATQVIIEASIMEVQLIDELRYGLEWTFKNNTINGNNNYSGLGTAGGRRRRPHACGRIFLHGHQFRRRYLGGAECP